MKKNRAKGGKGVRESRRTRKLMIEYSNFPSFEVMSRSLSNLDPNSEFPCFRISNVANVQKGRTEFASSENLEKKSTIPSREKKKRKKQKKRMVCTLETERKRDRDIERIIPAH